MQMRRPPARAPRWLEALRLTTPTGPLELSGPDVGLRDWRMSDWPVYARLCRDPRIVQWQIEEQPTRHEARRRFESALSTARSGPRGDFDLAIVSGADQGAVVGYVHLWQRIHHRPTLSLGYTVAPDDWGRGFATAAARLAVRAAFDDWGVERIVAGTFAHNRASRRVLQKLGFTLRATRPGRFRKGGRPVDDCRYALER